MENKIKSSAEFSVCKKYRYALWRVWDSNKPSVMFIGLNPSTADDVNNDPTVTRCINFARNWGYGGLCMANIFAYRETKRHIMKEQNDPIGPDNDKWLKKLAAESDLVVAAWGNDGAHLNRSKAVTNLIENLHCISLNKTGEPSHPLYLNSSLKAVPINA